MHICGTVFAKPRFILGTGSYSVLNFRQLSFHYDHVLIQKMALVYVPVEYQEKQASCVMNNCFQYQNVNHERLIQKRKT
jgi:hypothetical protein